MAEAIVRGDHRATANGSVAIDAYDIDVAPHVVADPGAAIEACIEAVAPPGMQHFIRGQGHPANATAKADSKTAPAKESDQRRRPIYVHRDGTWPPAPAVAGVPKPAAIMVRRPAPGCVIHPGPAVIRLPNPFAVAVGRPAGIGRLRRPDRPVLRRHPLAVCVQIRSAIDIRADILVAARSKQ